jgi:hypothetical protein
MSIAQAAGDDTEMDMTPMIDIVFQLIIFFLLSLKFKTVDRRIDSMLPKDRGLAATPTFPEDFLKIKIKVFRRDMSDPAKAHTMIKVDNEAKQYVLPKGWRGRLKEESKDPARVQQYDAVIAEIRQTVARKIKAHGGAVDEVKGEIVAPPPKGGAVPHGDVVQMLNIFLSVGMTDVVFEGQATPLNSTERAARNKSRGQ